MTRKIVSLETLKRVLEADTQIDPVSLGEFVARAKADFPNMAYKHMAELVNTNIDRLNYSYLSLNLPHEVKEIIREGRLAYKVVRRMVQIRGCPDEVLIQYAKVVVDRGLKVVDAFKLADELVNVNEKVQANGYTSDKALVLFAEALGVSVEKLKPVENETKLSQCKVTNVAVDSKTKDPYEPTLCGVGYLGEGKYRTTEWCSIKNRTVQTPAYDSWTKMMKRCYSEWYLAEYPTYRGCSVCEEWHNFQVFAEWYYKNFYTIGSERMELDKDFLVQDNREYGPKTCVFIPQSLNTMVTGRSSVSRKTPKGVTISNGAYVATLNGTLLRVVEGKLELTPLGERKKGKAIKIGTYDTEAEAFLAYRTVKEEYMREVAYQYTALEGLSPVASTTLKKVYDAICAYEILPYDYEEMAGRSCADVLGDLFITIEGKRYRNVREAVAAHGIDYSTFKLRLFSKEMTLEEAITGEIKDKNQSWVVEADHLGQKFKTQLEMYKHWGICPETFRSRRLKGYTLEEALTGNIHKDHLGKGFKSIKDMCKYWGVSHSQYLEHIQEGMTLEQALTWANYTDHKGNRFKSKKEMCEHWGVSPSAYDYRIKQGKTVKQALTPKKKTPNHTLPTPRSVQTVAINTAKNFPSHNPYQEVSVL